MQTSVHFFLYCRAQAIIAGKEPKDGLKDLLAMLRNSASNPQMDSIARVIKKWATDHRIEA